ncbi:MAG TPA: carboxypeptidase-like regulatory domain-containing protein [Acidobacteriaceae bacterium]
MTRITVMKQLRAVVGAAIFTGAWAALCAGAMAQAANDGQAQSAVQPQAQAGTAAAGVEASAAQPASTGTSTIQGVVKAGGVPLPGVAVTAVSGDGKKYATTTDINGTFRMDVPTGSYEVRTELMGFATVTKQVSATPADANVAQSLQFTTDLASRVQPEQGQTNAPVVASNPAPATGSGAAKPAAGATGPAGARSTPGTTTQAANGAPGAGARRPGVPGGGVGAYGGRRTVTNQGRGTQSLDVQGNQDPNLLDASSGSTSGDVSVPSLGGFGSEDAGAAANDSIAVTGTQGQTNGLAMFSETDLQNRIQGFQAQGLGNGDIAGALQGAMQTGSFGGPGGGPGPGGGFGGPGGGGPGGGFGGGPGGGGFGGGGGRGGGGGGGRGGGGFGGPGGFRAQNPNAWHGSVGYTGFNNAINANNFQTSGSALPKTDRSQNSLTASFTGTPFIPHLLAPNPKQFLFLSGSETRSNNPSSTSIFVPTAAQRLGDLTPAYQVGTPLGGTSAAPNTNVVYDPFVSTLSNPQPYGNTGCLTALYAIDPNPSACIPASEFNTPQAQAALALLNYYPQPNINTSQANFQANFPGSSHQSQVSARFNRSFGAQQRGRGGFGGGGRFGGGGPGGPGGAGNRPNVKPTLSQSIAENFSYQHSASASSSFSPLLSGTSKSDGYNFSSGYTLSYGRLNNSATLGWNRSKSLSSNLFTYLTNPVAGAGICVGTQTICGNPFYYGVPSVSITGGFGGLSDTTPVNSVNQTISFSDTARWRKGRHNLSLGFDFRRIHADSIGTGGDLGSFTFSGFATENPQLQACDPVTDSQKCAQYGTSGSSFADFLLGFPQNSNVTAGLNKIYLRGNSWDWFAQDDWRARSGLTFQFGLRWEYFSPYSEKYNRLVNLNVTGVGSSLAVSTVCGTAAPAGSPQGVCAAVQPGSQVKPDKALYSPRVSLAWSPKFKFTKSTVVRVSYGINYNTGQYSRFATNLAFQQPFSVTQKNVLSSGTTNTGCQLPSQNYGANVMTLTSGFNCTTQTTQSSYAVDPNYRLGMVQVWDFGIQRQLPQGVVLNVDYTGSLASNLDMLRAPNRTPSGLIVKSVGQFTYEDSLGFLRSNTLRVNLRSRMQKGISLGATYAYAHSIDNASSVGGSGNSIAQNDQDLLAEESNSSFDQRHSLTGNFVLEPPVGPNRAFLNKGGLWSHALDGFNISGAFTFATGGFATPSYSLTAQEIAAGAPSSLRPNRNYGVAIKGKGSLQSWFNTAAFSAPVAGTYGTATRNSIQLPGTVAVSSSLSRTVSFGETRSLEMRLNANNVFNTVQYSGVDTTVNDPRFGQVTGAAAMRSFTYNMRFRF